MPISRPWIGVIAAGVSLVASSAAHASIADVFTPGPRVDLALELDYRSRFLTPDAAVASDVAADRIGRERLDAVRIRVARAYLDRLGDDLADELLEQVTLLRLLERRYRQYANLRLAGNDPDPTVQAVSSGSARVVVGDDDRFSLRLRLNALSEGFDLAPGLHLVRGVLEWRLAYRPLSERLEMAARRPLTDRLAVELTGGQSLTHGGPEIQVGLTLNF